MIKSTDSARTSFTKFRTALLCLILCLLGLAVPASAQGPTIVSFDVPASTSTVPLDINLEGTTTGFYSDASGIVHGFLRYAGGKITTFDAPGAGTNPNNFDGTFPVGINLLGTVTGYINDSNGVSHGFTRTSDGKFAIFDAPGADVNPADRLGTLSTSINDLGAISGFYFDSTSLGHGFLLKPNGEFTSFEVAGAGASGTTPTNLNLEGTLVGFYQDANLQFHGFVRNPGGKITTLDGPGACNTGTSAGCFGTGVNNINIFGTGVGSYMDNSGNFVAHQFLRRADGTITTWEAPGAGNGLYQGTGFNEPPALGITIAGLNNAGVVASIYVDANYTTHGYVRTPDGKFTTIDAPGADITPGNFAGTWLTRINDFGAIAGWYVDSSFTIHGFVRTPW